MTNFDFQRELLDARWNGPDLLVRSQSTVETWSAKDGNASVIDGLPNSSGRDCLGFHPSEGYFYKKSGYFAAFKKGHRNLIFPLDSQICSIKLCDKADFLGVMTKVSLDVFNTQSGDNLGSMAEIIGGYALWDGLLFCQVDNPKGEGLMVVDLAPSKLIQGGPSGYRAIEQLVLSDTREWLFGISPSQNIVVGWLLEEGCFPVVRWEHHTEQMLDAIPLPQNRILLFEASGQSKILDSTGQVERTLPLQFKGQNPTLLKHDLVGAIDENKIWRWNLNNGEGVSDS